MCWTAVEAATPQALADLLQSIGRYTNGTPWPASRQMDNGRGPSRARQLTAASLRRDNEATRRATIEGDLAASTELRCARTATRRLDAMPADLTQQLAVSPRPTPPAVRKWSMLTPSPAMPRHASRQGFPTMTKPMLARCRIDGCRRCRCRCWPGATSREVVDADANADHAQACAASRVPDDDETDAGLVPHR